VLLCATGGIACYKTADLTSKLVQKGAGVTVAMTEAATRFVGPITFEALTGRKVHTSMWQGGGEHAAVHLELTERADLMAVVPATANILAKFAAGLADDLVSTLGLSAQGTCKILLAPAMNTRMWEAPSTQANVEKLRGWGAATVGPASGHLACGTQGLGRLAETEEILTEITEMLLTDKPKSAS